MIQRPRAYELIAGIAVDATFGPIALFGQGGTAVEVIADTAVALLPLNRALASDLVSRKRIQKLLDGFRDRKPIKRPALELALVQLSQLAVDCAKIVELDINPLLADKQGVIALDVRVRIAPTSGGSAGEANAAASAVASAISSRSTRQCQSPRSHLQSRVQRS